MSAHHDNDHHVTESKPVSFRTPLIFGLVVIFLILLLVSTCDGGHHKGKCEHEGECTKECMANEHGEHHGHEAAATEHTTATEHEVAATEEPVVDSVGAVADSLVKTMPVAEEKPHH